jgi:hypothetical protein
MNLDDMKQLPRVVYDPRDTHDEGGYSLEGGFGVGLQAFFGMLFVGIGTGIAVPNATANAGARRGVTAILALAWHGVGVGTCWSYCVLAPALDVWPFLAVTMYAWLGLVPLALAIPNGERTGRLRSAIWYAMGGGFLGGVAGAVIGGIVGGVAVLVSSLLDGDIAGTTWWLYAAMGGGLTASAAFALLRLKGWEVPDGSGESTPRHPPREPPRSKLCRKCHMPLEPRLATCRVCRAPVGMRFRWPSGRVVAGAGFVCVVGTWFVLNPLLGWLVSKGFNPTVLNYLFWMIFIGGWIMIGLGSLLSSAKPASRTRDHEDGADDSERSAEDHELSY